MKVGKVKCGGSGVVDGLEFLFFLVSASRVKETERKAVAKCIFIYASCVLLRSFLYIFREFVYRVNFYIIY